MPAKVQAPAGNRYVRQVIIEFDADVRVERVENIVREISAISGLELRTSGDLGFHMYLVSLGKERELTKVAAILSLFESREEIVSASPNIRSETEVALDETSDRTNVTWGLDRIDQDSRILDNDYQVSAFEGSSVTSYVLDSGVAAIHSELTGRVLPGYSAFVDGCGTEDVNGHGTHVAGTIDGNTFGVARQAQVVPVRVFDSSGRGDAAAFIRGALWIKSNHAVGVPAVVNISLRFQGIVAAVDSAVEDLVADGMTVVVASGNDAQDACYSSPSRVPSAITVNASTPADDDAGFSNYGACPDKYAPGLDITSADRSDPTGSVSKDGTSMSAPHVAGVAALVLIQQPSLSPEAVWNLIADSAIQFDPLPQVLRDAKLLLNAKIVGIVLNA